MTRVKICGVTSRTIAEVAVEAGADAVGFVFVPGSPRYVPSGIAESIRAGLPASVAAVGVFQNQSRREIEQWGGEWVQLHGDEDEEAARLPGSVIKALRFDVETIRRWNRCDLVAALLIEGEEGGSGRDFDHEALAGLMPEIDKPVMLAGGLTADNVAEAIARVRPYAVDVSSGVESTRGKKDPQLIREFCEAVREADGRRSD